MKRRSPRAFTLIELVVVLFVIVLLAALVVSIAAHANQNSARRLAAIQIKDLGRACEDYKVDHGTYPQNESTDLLDPRKVTDPLDPLYADCSRYLYSCLSGDYLPAALPDHQPEPGNKSYFDFKPALLEMKSADGNPTLGVRYIKDPFGYPFGYSTAGAVQEAQYREQLQANPSAARPATHRGYNPTFDLWSTAGKTTPTGTASWETNWGH